MRFNKKDWKVTDCGETISIKCVNSVMRVIIDEPAHDGFDEITHEDNYTEWPSNNWFRKNFHLCKNLKKNTELIPADGDEVFFDK